MLNAWSRFYIQNLAVNNFLFLIFLSHKHLLDSYESNLGQACGNVRCLPWACAGLPHGTPLISDYREYTSKLSVFYIFCRRVTGGAWLGCPRLKAPTMPHRAMRAPSIINHLLRDDCSEVAVLFQKNPQTKRETGDSTPKARFSRVTKLQRLGV